MWHWLHHGGKPLRTLPAYLIYVLPSFMGSMILVIGMFIIRLDCSPKFAMAANIIASLLNILLDYMFVFPWDMGVKGAAIATSVSQWIGAVIVIVYMVWLPKTIRFYKPKFTRKSIRLTTRNVGYMVKLGGAAFIGETAMACMMVVGNIMFMSRLKEDGVAVFSVACYLLPLIFMFGNSIVQSALPIIVITTVSEMGKDQAYFAYFPEYCCRIWYCCYADRGILERAYN